MPRYKPSDCHALMLPVVLSEQIVPGSFAFALSYLVDQELDPIALAARFKNDTTGASAYDPRVMLKIVLPACSKLVCHRNTLAATHEPRCPRSDPEGHLCAVFAMATSTP